MNPPTTSIDDLPPEMISELFEYLPLKDLATCSLVSKRWYSIYVAFKPRSLITIDYNERHLFYLYNKFYDSNQPIMEANWCSRVIFYRLAEKPLLSNLKHLALYGHSVTFDLNDFNRFSQLVCLEIYSVSLNRMKVQLKLSKLKVLAFHRSNEDCSLSIDCPQLSTLLYEHEDANLLDVKHPETIRKLETDMLAPKLVPFKRVECLVTKRFQVIDKAILLSLPKLRELHFNQNILFAYEFHERGGVDRVKQTLSEFVDEAKRLKGNDFQFSFLGLQLTKVRLEQIDFGEGLERGHLYNEYFHMKNYHLIEPSALHYVRRIDYSHLLRHATGEFPRCFSRKFTGIYKVQVNELVKDPDQLLWFLKSLRSLRILKLEIIELSQEFYDQLPASAYLLVSLDMRVGYYKTQWNFDFIKKFSSISHLTIRPFLSLESNSSVRSLDGLSLESANSLVRSSDRLAECFFIVQSKENPFRIEKRRHSTKWKILKNKQMQFEFKNSDEMLNFFEGLQRV